jgi:prepilin-type N-terminal cleavage/methylation domain-containing protein
MAATASPGTRRGFTLMEVLMALSILVAGAAVMVVPLYQYSKRMNGVGLIQLRNGVLAQQVGRLTALPFDSLATRAGCTSIPLSPIPHTRCVTLTAVSTSQTRLTLLLTPVSTLVRPVSVVFDRSRVSSANPFNN